MRTCGRAIDDSRLRVIHRIIQYYTTVVEALTRNGLVPADVIKHIYELLADDLEHDPQHKIIHFENPHSIWQEGVNPILTEIEKLEEFKLPEGKEAWVFIHGLRYKATQRDGSDFEILKEKKNNAFEFYEFFEKEAKMFDPDRKTGPDYSNVNVYLVSYDTEMSDEDEEKIKVLIEALAMGGTHFPLLMAAIYWREMERRAKLTGVYIRPFLKKLRHTNEGRAITHSLGCYVMAQAAESIVLEPTPNYRVFKSWWAMNAAMPSDAFTNTGDFQKAISIAGPITDIPPNVDQGTTVWYSLGDIVLMLLYPLANFHTALGQTGIGIVEDESEKWLADLDVISVTGINHSWKDYSNSAGSCIRKFLNTHSDSDGCPLL